MVLKKENNESLKTVTNILLRRQPAIVPCDTVYGFIGVVPDCNDSIHQIKGREQVKPFLRLISSFKILEENNILFPDWLHHYWPGPLTIIQKIPSNLIDSTGNTSVAFRFPNDSWLLEIIENAGGQIYSTSVNRSGQKLLNSVEEIVNEFGTEVPLIIDAGNIDGVSSTIIDFTTFPYTIVRQGSLVIPKDLLNQS